MTWVNDYENGLSMMSHHQVEAAKSLSLVFWLGKVSLKRKWTLKSPFPLPMPPQTSQTTHCYLLSWGLGWFYAIFLVSDMCFYIAAFLKLKSYFSLLILGGDCGHAWQWWVKKWWQLVEVCPFILRGIRKAEVRFSGLCCKHFYPLGHFFDTP